MNWLNLHISVLDSEEFLGATPIERATWLCLQRYCIGQENGGRIVGARLWKDRKWQQVVRVMQEEVTMDCVLWRFEGDDLIVAFYPDDKEAEVQHLRALGKAKSDAKRAAAKANGSKGGRPVNNPTETEQETQRGTERKTQQETQREHNLNNPTETHRKEVEVEGKGSRREGDSAPAPLCSISQAMEYRGQCRMTEAEATFWWHARNKAGWTCSSASGGHPRKITSWQSDMATAKGWVGKQMAESAATNGGGPKW